MFERQRTLVQAVDPGRFLVGLRSQVDLTDGVRAFGPTRRFHPYLGRVDRSSFLIKKRTGIPWDHFSPTCRGRIESSAGRLRVDYRISRITGAWVASWLYILASFVVTVGVAVLAARDVAAGGDAGRWTPLLILSGLFALGGLLMMFILNFAKSVAEGDSAELESLLRSAAEPDEPADHGIEDTVGGTLATFPESRLTH